MNKTRASKATKDQARFGYYAVGGMKAKMRCPICGEWTEGYVPRYAETYDNGVSYLDRMTTHIMEEH